MVDLGRVVTSNFRTFTNFVDRAFILRMSLMIDPIYTKICYRSNVRVLIKNRTGPDPQNAQGNDRLQRTVQPMSTVFCPTVSYRSDHLATVRLNLHCFNIFIILITQLETKNAIVVISVFRNAQTGTWRKDKSPLREQM